MLLRTTLAALAALACAPSVAAAAVPVIDIPGVRGRGVELTGAVRLDDGGAIVAGAAGGRVIAVRLRANGLPDRHYGRRGVVRLRRGAATALAADPRSGRAWLGAGGVVLALDGRGAPVRGFAAAVPGRVAALAVSGDTLVVAGGADPCPGCQTAVLDAATGEARPGGAVVRRVAAGESCTGERVSGLALLGGGDVVVAGRRDAAGRCPLQLPHALDPRAVRTAVARAPDGAACLAIQRPAAASLQRIDASGGVLGPAARGRGGRLRAVAPLLDRGCTALVRGRRSLVLQARHGERRARVTALPRSVVAGALFRCKRHVLVVGSRSLGHGRRVAVVAVVRAVA